MDAPGTVRDRSGIRAGLNETDAPGGGGRHAGEWLYAVWVWMLFAVIALACALLLMPVRSQARARRIVHAGARLLLRLAGAPLSAQGLDRLPPHPHILVANHASFLDAIALTALLPPKPGYAFTTRQEFAIQRVFCPILRPLGTLVMQPHEHLHGHSNVERMEALLHKGESLIVFPEGGFDPKPGIKPFHHGAFLAAARAGVPLVVAGLWGARAALPPRTWFPRRLPLALMIGSVLQPAGGNEQEIQATTMAARDEMALLTGEPEAAA